MLCFPNLITVTVGARNIVDQTWTYIKERRIFHFTEKVVTTEAYPDPRVLFTKMFFNLAALVGEFQEVSKHEWSSGGITEKDLIWLL